MNGATHWILWAPLGAATLHIVEEFFFPGGFAAWDRAYRPEIARSITPRFHVIVNGLFLVLCYDAGAFGERPAGIALWLTVAAILLSNAIWHVIGTVKTRRYSPGVVTGLLLYMPLAVYGYAHFLRSGQASVTTALIAFLVGGSYQWWIGNLLHRWRTARAKH